MTHTRPVVYVVVVITADRCVCSPPACDDECTGVLLDDLEELHNHFLTINRTSIVTAPYGQLVLLQNRSRDTRVHTTQQPGEHDEVRKHSSAM